MATPPRRRPDRREVVLMYARSTILRATPEVLRGPGHNSVVVGPDGEPRIVYHAWDETMSARQMHIDRLRWVASPFAEGPRWLPRVVTDASG